MSKTPAKYKTKPSLHGLSKEAKAAWKERSKRWMHRWLSVDPERMGMHAPRHILENYQRATA